MTYVVRSQGNIVLAFERSTTEVEFSKPDSNGIVSELQSFRMKRSNSRSRWMLITCNIVTYY